VFRACGGIIKIFAPAESGNPPTEAEAAGMRHGEARGVPGPAVLASGELRDRYVFPYIVMEEIAGREAMAVFPASTEAEKRGYAAQVRVITDRLNVKPVEKGIENVLLENIRENGRWKPFPDVLRAAALSVAEGLDPGSFVFVHGDLTKENVLVDGSGRLRVIDFGDCQLAPAFYEWTPLVFDLFQRDEVLLDAYFGADRGEAFIETLTDAVLIHDFGGGFAVNLCSEQGRRPAEIAGRAELRELIKRSLGG
jgi:serine/threonine protein kinase